MEGIAPEDLQTGASGILRAIGADDKEIGAFEFTSWGGSREDGQKTIYIMNGARPIQ